MKSHNNIVRRTVVSTVAGATTMLVLSVALLSFTGRPVPDPLVRMADTSLVALVALLSKTTDTDRDDDHPGQPRSDDSNTSSS